MPSGQRRTKKEETSPDVIKSKRQKKEINVIAIVTPNGIQGTFQTENRRPLIAHLPVKTNEVVFDETHQESSEPMPYDPNDESVFNLGQEFITQNESVVNSVESVKKEIYGVSK